MKDLILLIKNYWKIILIIAILSTLCATGFRLVLAKSEFTGTTFITIGVLEEANNANSIYDNVQAADHFSESIQGWFKNPVLGETIKSATGAAVGINAKKQEKQNLVISYSNSDKNIIENVDQTLKKELTNYLNSYNISTGTQFTLALYNTDIQETTKSLATYIFLGLILGICTGIGLSAIHQKFHKEWKNISKS